MNKVERIEFVVKDIESITFTPRKKLHLKYHDIIPETRKWFGTRVDRKEFRDGWSINGYPRYDYDYGTWSDWWTLKEIEKSNAFQLDGYNINEPWYMKATVLVKKYNKEYTSYFKTDKAALKYIDEVKALCSENFKVVINE